MDCIDLTDRFGKQYRISFDPAYDPKSRPRDKLDRWMMVIEGQRGTIYPYGRNLLAVEVEGRPVTSRKLLTLLGTTVVQDGENFTAFTFDASLFAEVAIVVRSRRRRVVSEAERVRLRKVGEAHRFRSAQLRQSERFQRAPTHRKTTR